MTRIHRPSHRQDDGEGVGLPWQRLAPPAQRTSAVRDPVDESVAVAAPLPSIDIGDVGEMTLDELTTAAAMLRVSPSSLLGADAQARLHADLDFASRLPAHIAELAVSVAQLHPDTAATLLTAMRRRPADVPSAPRRPAR